MQNFFMTITPENTSDGCLWAEMLFRMYLRWAERVDCPATIIYSDEADFGMRACVLLFEGEHAATLQQELGTHHLFWVSPLDKRGKRSMASATVELLSEPEMLFDDQDLRIDCYAPGGICGQQVTGSIRALRLTHVPTGVSIVANGGRSQKINRDLGRRWLAARLMARPTALRPVRKYQLEPDKAAHCYVTNTVSDAVDDVLRGQIPGLP